MLRTALSIFTLLISSLSTFAQVELPKLINDGMVLQRETPIKIWGWASPGEEVTVIFKNESFSSVTDNSGTWMVTLPEQSAGGPFNMKITASNSVTLQDILVGDVWLASGQSNMELPMYRVAPLYREELETANYPEIRHFDVPQVYNFDAENTDFEGGEWISISPKTISNRSAVGYFFSKRLHQEYEVPIGIINSSLGGSPAEAWLSEDALKEFPDYYHEAQMYKNSDMRMKIMEADQARSNTWHRVSAEEDLGYKNKHWANPDLNDAGWQTMDVPGYWHSTSLGNKNGIVWFRKEIDIPDEMAGKEVELELGRIVDADSTFINGVFVGNTTYQYPPRWYIIPQGVLKEGKNTIAIRVINQSGNGGFFFDKPYEIRNETDTLNLEGPWKMKLGVEMPPLASQTFIRWKPLGLFNGMIAPMLNYNIKGAIWYQGESNVKDPKEYKDLFPAMIENWRSRFNEPNLPFIYVQLANFMKAYEKPTDSGWARMREAQLKTLKLKNTAMAVAIDVGEWNDIHPLNKKTVAERLVLGAKKVAYGEDIVHSGPVLESMEVKENKVELTFSNTGTELTTSDGKEVKEIAIAGSDQNFRWAKAKIENNKLVVWHDDIPNPVAVRYAWADNPDDANLYNKEGLPASPFRTDDW